MAIDITVLRGGGAYPGEDIVDPLLSTLAAALARGKTELNANASGLQEVSLEVPYNFAYRHGKLCQLVDTDTFEVSYGKIVSVSHTFRRSVDEVSFTSTLTLEKVSNFAVAV